MSDIILNLIVLAVLGMGTGVIFLILRLRRKNQTSNRLEQIRQLGWEITPIRHGSTSGTLYAGREGDMTWQLETTRTIKPTASYTGSDSTAVCLTCWQTQSGAFDEGLMLLGYTTGSTLPGGGFSGLTDVVMQKALRMMVGEDAERLPQLKQVALPIDFKNHYMAFSTHPLQMQQVLIEPVFSALADWPQKYPLVVKIDHRGVEIKVFSHQIEDIVSLKQLTRLGVAISQARQ